MTPRDPVLPLEDFIKAVQAQLDDAQAAMGIRARNAGLPLTFAVKDISMNLRAHVDFQAGQVRIRPAAAGDSDASSLNIVFAAITRPAIDEGAVSMAVDDDDQALEDLGDELSDEDRRRLQWAGIRTVGKLRELQGSGDERQTSRASTLPVERLRKALARASAPLVEHVLPVDRRADDPPDLPGLLRIRGRNLTRDGLPRVAIDGRPVSVVQSSDREMLLAPGPGQWSGELTLAPERGPSTAMAFDLSAWAPAPPPSPPTAEEGAT